MDKIIKECLENLNYTFDFGYGKKENALFNLIKDYKPIYLKDIGFVIPSKKMPTKVVSVPLFNKLNLSNITDVYQEKTSSFVGFLQDNIMNSFLIKSLEDKRDDVIYVFYEGTNSSPYLGLLSFIKTVDKTLLETLIFINLSLKEIEKNSIEFDNLYSLELINFLKEQVKLNIKEGSLNRSLYYVSGFDLVLKYSKEPYGRAINILKEDIKDFMANLNILLDLDFKNVSLFKDIRQTKIEDVLSKNKEETYKKEQNNLDNSLFKNSLYDLFIELKLSFLRKDEDFIVKYITTKHKENKPLLTNFLFKKYGKNIMTYLKQLQEYKVIKKLSDGDYMVI